MIRLSSTGFAGVAALLLISSSLDAQTQSGSPPVARPDTLVPVTPRVAAPKPIIQPDKPVLAAKAILDEALKEAKKAGKVVFVEFSASWCTWCHKLENFLETPIGKELNQYVVIRKLIVLEDASHKLFENAGGENLMQSWGGGGGIPFYAFLDVEGNKLSDANGMKDGSNIGYPANAAEVAAFDEVLRKGVPKLPADLRARIIDQIAKNP